MHNLVIKSFIFFFKPVTQFDFIYIGSIAMAKNNLTRPLGLLKKHQKNAIKQWFWHNIIMINNNPKISVEIFSATFCCTKTTNFFIFNGKFVIVGDFFSISDWLFGVNYNFLFSINSNNLCITIWLKNKIIEFLKLKMLFTKNKIFFFLF